MNIESIPRPVWLVPVVLLVVAWRSSPFCSTPLCQFILIGRRGSTWTSAPVPCSLLT
jgi:hypothetical protein